VLFHARKRQDERERGTFWAPDVVSIAPWLTGCNDKLTLLYLIITVFPRENGFSFPDDNSVTAVAFLN
jgi:hypothetical protein